MNNFMKSVTEAQKLVQGQAQQIQAELAVYVTSPLPLFRTVLLSHLTVPCVRYMALYNILGIFLALQLKLVFNCRGTLSFAGCV